MSLSAAHEARDETKARQQEAKQAELDATNSPEIRKWPDAQPPVPAESSGDGFRR